MTKVFALVFCLYSFPITQPDERIAELSNCLEEYHNNLREFSFDFRWRTDGNPDSLVGSVARHYPGFQIDVRRLQGAFTPSAPRRVVYLSLGRDWRTFLSDPQTDTHVFCRLLSTTEKIFPELSPLSMFGFGDRGVDLFHIPLESSQRKYSFVALDPQHGGGWEIRDAAPLPAPLIRYRFEAVAPHRYLGRILEIKTQRPGVMLLVDERVTEFGSVAGLWYPARCSRTFMSEGAADPKDPPKQIMEIANFRLESGYDPQKLLDLQKSLPVLHQASGRTEFPPGWAEKMAKAQGDALDETNDQKRLEALAANAGPNVMDRLMSGFSFSDATWLILVAIGLAACAMVVVWRRR